MTVSVEATNAAARSANEKSQAVENTAPKEEPDASSVSPPPVSIEIATANSVESIPQTNNRTAQVDASTPISLPAVAESPDDSIEDLPEEVAAELAEGGSSESYTWAPPVPTSFVPLSNQPLRAVKYETGSAVPAKQDDATPPKPASDPWLEKHVPNQ